MRGTRPVPYGRAMTTTTYTKVRSLPEETVERFRERAAGTDAFTHETLDKALLGVNGDGPRW